MPVSFGDLYNTDMRIWLLKAQSTWFHFAISLVTEKEACRQPKPLIILHLVITTKNHKYFGLQSLSDLKAAVKYYKVGIFVCVKMMRMFCIEMGGERISATTSHC